MISFIAKSKRSYSEKEKTKQVLKYKFNVKYVFIICTKQVAAQRREVLLSFMAHRESLKEDYAHPNLWWSCFCFWVACRDAFII